jgi:hypothetical protein
MVSPDVAKYGLHPYAIIVLPIPLAVLSSIAISIRIWVRCCLARSFGRDDVCLIIAHVSNSLCAGGYSTDSIIQICFLAACGVFIAIGVTEYNQGLEPIVTLAEVCHASSRSLVSTAVLTIIITKQLSILGIALYLLNQCFFKLSMAFFFLRIPNRALHRWIIIVSVSISIIFNLILLGVSIGQCGNISTIDLNHPQCLSWKIQGPLNYFCAALNAAVDWIFAFLAIYVVHGLIMDTRSKLSVYAIIVLASLGSVVSVVRIPYIPGLRLDTDYYNQQNDVIAYTSLIESAIGIIVASMSVMRPLVTRLFLKAKIALSSDRTSRTSQRKQTPLKIDLPTKSGTGVEIKLYQALPDPTPTHLEVSGESGIEMDYLSVKGSDDVERVAGLTYVEEIRT